MSSTRNERAAGAPKPARGSLWGSLLTLLLLTPCLLVVGFLIVIQSLYHSQRSFFYAEDAAQTCSLLRFPPESAFCTGAEKQNTPNLQRIIAQTYPTGSTTITELDEQFLARMICDKGVCDVDLPMGWVYLYIYYDDNEHVRAYMIDDQRGS